MKIKIIIGLPFIIIEVEGLLLYLSFSFVKRIVRPLDVNLLQDK